MLLNEPAVDFIASLPTPTLFVCGLSDRTYAEQMKAAGLGLAFVSLHSNDATTSDDQITMFPGGWARTTVGIDNAVAVGLRVQVNHVVHRANVGQTEAFFRFAQARWGRKVELSLAFVAPTGSAAADVRKFVPPLPEVVPSVVSALAYAQSHRLPVVLQSFCGFPPCLLGEHAALSETSRLDTVDYPADRIQLDACKSCAFQKGCPGLWKPYYETYGDPGLTPIAANDARRRK